MAPDAPMAETHATHGKLKSRHISMIAFGGIVGAGLFVGSSVAIAGAGPAALLAYIATAALVMIVLRALGDMLLALPRRGSFIDYIRLGNGEWAGFVCGWLYWLYWVVVIGSEAIAGAILLRDWVNLPIWVLAMGLVVIVKLINMVSANLFGECEFWLALIKLVCISAFLAITVVFLAHLFGTPPDIAANLTGHGGFVPHGWTAILAMIPTVLFSMMGPEIATVAAAETDDAETNINQVTRSVTIRMSLFYIGSIGLILCAVPWKSVLPGHSPFVTAMEVMGIPGSATIIRLVVFSAIFSCLNSSIYVTSRIMQGLATAGSAPRWFGVVSANGVPYRAVATGSFLGLLVAFSSILSPKTIFAFLVGANGATILVVYLLILTAFLRLRGTMIREGAWYSPRLSRFPWEIYATIFGMFAIISEMLVAPDQKSIVLASLGCTLFFLAAYGVRAVILSRRNAASVAAVMEQGRA